MTTEAPLVDLADYAAAAGAPACAATCATTTNAATAPTNQPGVAAHAATQTKLNPLFHYIHGRAYDMRPFFAQHPGGKDILIMTQGLIDATPAFESLHAFANRPDILRQLERYAVDAPCVSPTLYTFADDGFYRTLVRRVRSEFGAQGDAQSITHLVKADKYWLAKVSVQVAVSLVSFALCFLSGNTFSTAEQCVFAAVAGCFFMQWCFTVMHDASHYAVVSRSPLVNTFLTRTWTAMGFWVCRVWMLHHVVLHHSFTGTTHMDPDLHHFTHNPRTFPSHPRALNVHFHTWLGKHFGFGGWVGGCVLIYFLVPGLWAGQALLYFAFTFRIGAFKHLWGMTYNDGAFARQGYEYVLTFLHVAAHWYRGSLLVSYVFFTALNFWYAMCILADHDTEDAVFSNHIDAQGVEPRSGSAKHDWGSVQVSNSSNFGNHALGDAFAKANGCVFSCVLPQRGDSRPLT